MKSEISIQEENPESDERVDEEDEDDSDGPPPGFQRVITPQLHQPKKDEVDEEEDEDPPHGFHCTAPKPSPALHSSDEDSKPLDVEDDNDDDGPPPGWEFFSMANALPKLPSNSADAILESNAKLNEGESDDDSDDEGPPPGWEKVLHYRMPPSCTPPLQPSQAVSSDSEMGSQHETSKNNDEMPQTESRLTPFPLLGQSLPQTPQLQQLPPSVSPTESWSKGDSKDVDERPKSVPAAASMQSVPSATHPSTTNVGSSSSEKAQLVCGTCRKLLLYPRGAKWVQCPGCQEVNFVLEAHEVGQVKCGNCTVLLMYPHGAPAVQCTSCSFITEIDANNRRPPLSVQMAQRRRRSIRGRAR